MPKNLLNHRLVWLTIGVLAGLAVAYVMPQNDVKAVTTDRDSNFALATASVTFGNGVEGIFVLDFLTGQLRGGILNTKTGKFSYSYIRNIAADFNVDPRAKPHYAIVSGRANLPSIKRVSMAQGVVYVAELTSGKVLCYGFPYTNKQVNTPIPMILLDGFPFREAVGN